MKAQCDQDPFVPVPSTAFRADPSMISIQDNSCDTMSLISMSNRLEYADRRETIATSYLYPATSVDLGRAEVVKFASRIGAIAPNSAAEAAGILPGDLLLAVNGSTFTSPAQLYTLTRQFSDKPVTLLIERKGVRQEITALPVLDSASRMYRLGFSHFPETATPPLPDHRIEGDSKSYLCPFYNTNQELVATVAIVLETPSTRDVADQELGSSAYKITACDMLIEAEGGETKCYSLLDRFIPTDCDVFYVPTIAGNGSWGEKTRSIYIKNPFNHNSVHTLLHEARHTRQEHMKDLLPFYISALNDDDTYFKLVADLLASTKDLQSLTTAVLHHVIPEKKRAIRVERQILLKLEAASDAFLTHNQQTRLRAQELRRALHDVALNSQEGNSKKVRAAQNTISRDYHLNVIRQAVPAAFYEHVANEPTELTPEFCYEALEKLGLRSLRSSACYHDLRLVDAESIISIYQSVRNDLDTTKTVEYPALKWLKLSDVEPHTKSIDLYSFSNANSVNDFVVSFTLTTEQTRAIFQAESQARIKRNNMQTAHLLHDPAYMQLYDQLDSLTHDTSFLKQLLGEEVYPGLTLEELLNIPTTLIERDAEAGALQGLRTLRKETGKNLLQAFQVYDEPEEDPDVPTIRQTRIESLRKTRYYSSLLAPLACLRNVRQADADSSEDL